MPILDLLRIYQIEDKLIYPNALYKGRVELGSSRKSSDNTLYLYGKHHKFIPMKIIDVLKSIDVM